MRRSDYKTLSEFSKDVLLMFSNCIKYNIGPEGQWFRDEARRQQKVFQDHISNKAESYYKKELIKRKKVLDRADALALKEEKKKKKEAAEQEKAAAAALAAKKKAELKKTNEKSNAASSTEEKKRKFGKDTDVCDDSKAQDIKPLPPFSYQHPKRVKRDPNSNNPHPTITYPPMPCLASMLLSDPFVVRL
eukprot:13072650-Ditylum_brightwellii.AAC.1